MDEEIFDSSATSQILVTQTDLQLRELEIKRQVEMEKLRLEHEDRIRMETLERGDRLSREKLEHEKLRLKMEEQEKEKQREMEREKLEHEKLRLEIEEKERQRQECIEIEKEKIQFELKMKELELEGKSKSKPLPLDSGKSFDVTKHIRLVPPFQEKEVDKYFLHFEKVTEKELILKAYELVPEAYRQKFRNCRKEPNQNHVEFARTKEQLFDRWCSSKSVGSDHEKLRQLMLVEEFKWCINSDVRAFLNEKEVENFDVAARLADDYSLTHKTSFVNKPIPRKPFNPQLKFTTQSRPLSFSQNHIPLSQVQNPTPVIHPIIPVIHLLPNLDFLVKTKIKVLYPSQFAIIVNNQAISFLNV